MCWCGVVERVNHKPIVTQAPQNATVEVGGDVNFTCKFLSDLHPRLSWIKNTYEPFTNNINDTKVLGLLTSTNLCFYCTCRKKETRWTRCSNLFECHQNDQIYLKPN